MHSPIQIDVENLDQFVSSLGVMCASYRREELANSNVGSYDGVQHPFETEIGYTDERVLEGIKAGDGDCGGRSEPFAGEET